MIEQALMYGDGWTAMLQCRKSTEVDGLYHAYCTTKGESKEHALAAAQWVFDMLCTDREAYIRAVPEANSEQDYDSKEWRHAGFTRFAFKLSAGKHHYVNESASVPLGFAGSIAP